MGGAPRPRPRARSGPVDQVPGAGVRARAEDPGGPPRATTQAATFAAWPPAPKVIRAGVSSSVHQRAGVSTMTSSITSPRHATSTPSPSSACRVPRAESPHDDTGSAQSLVVSDEVSDAIASGAASSRWSPRSSATACRPRRAPDRPRDRGRRTARGAVPATVAVVDGTVRVGLDDDALVRVAEERGRGQDQHPRPRAGARQRLTGATTVAATAYVAAPGRHPGLRDGRARRGAPGARDTWDESADLPRWPPRRSRWCAPG